MKKLTELLSNRGEKNSEYDNSQKNKNVFLQTQINQKALNQSIGREEIKKTSQPTDSSQLSPNIITSKVKTANIQKTSR